MRILHGGAVAGAANFAVDQPHLSRGEADVALLVGSRASA